MTANASHIGITSEYIVTTEALKRGYNVLQPVGGFLAYDLVLDIQSVLVKVQVKTAHLIKKNRYISCLSSRQVNNKYRSGSEKYVVGDFDFAAVICKDFPIYIVPFFKFTQSKTFIVPLSGNGKNGVFVNAWNLIEEFAASKAHWCERLAFNPVTEEFDPLSRRFGVE